MSVVYLVSDDGKLIKKGDVLKLIKRDKETETIFLHRTEQIIIIGRTDITSSALQTLMKHRIETVFISRNGRFNGRIEFQAGRNVLLRKRQYQLLDDNPFRLEFAKSIVLGKLKNQMGFVRRLSRKDRIPKELFDRGLSTLQTMYDQVDRTSSMDALRGIEGMGARAFFSIYKYAFKPEWALFPGRSRNPPQSNVNALLSFLYTLLLYRVDGALEAEGLDPCVGMFHRCDYGKRSLAFDLIEEFRTPIADTLCAAIINLGVLGEDSFREVSFNECQDAHPMEYLSDSMEIEAQPVERRGILLTPEGLRKVITQFERKLDDEILFPDALSRTSYRNLFRKQAQRFRRVILGEVETYTPLNIR